MSARLAPNGLTAAEWLEYKSVTAPSGCRVWLGALNRDGYGVATFRGQCRTAQRMAYEAFVGPLPREWQVDHLCRYRRCINPRHLQAVPVVVNFLRGTSPSARRSRSALCIRGHRYAEQGYLDPEGRRRCRSCVAIWRAARTIRRRSQVVARPAPVYPPHESDRAPSQRSYRSGCRCERCTYYMRLCWRRDDIRRGKYGNADGLAEIEAELAAVAA